MRRYSEAVKTDVRRRMRPRVQFGLGALPIYKQAWRFRIKEQGADGLRSDMTGYRTPCQIDDGDG